MTKCISCKEETSNKTVIYGVIEKYHYDSRRTTSDTDYGPTEFSAHGIIGINYCDKCLKEANKKSNKKALKNIGIAFVFIIVGALLSNVSTEFAGILVLVALISLIYSIYTFFKNFTTKSKMIAALNGKVPKECVLMPKVDEDLDVREVPISYDYRQRFHYIYVNEEKLKKPKRETKNNKSYTAALNKLKDYYQQINKEDINNISCEVNKKDVIVEEEIKTEEIKEEPKINNNGKRRKIIIFVVTAFIVLGILGGLLALIINGINPNIDLEEYLYNDIGGYELNGKYKRAIDYNLLIDEKGKKIKFVDGPLTGITDENVDKKRLQEVAEYIVDNDYSYQSAFEIIDIYDYDKNTLLSTGDVINYTLNDDLKILNLLFKCNFKAPENGAYEVLEYDLKEDTRADLLWWFDDSYIKYEGSNGDIKAKLDLDDLIDTVVYEKDDLKITLGYYYGAFGKEYYLYLYSNDEEIDSWLIALDKDEKLSTGEHINLYIHEYERLEDYGIVPQYHSIFVVVKKQKTDELASEKLITKEMVEDFINRDLTTRYDNFDDLEIQYVTLRKAMFFKMPEGVEDLKSLITLDYNYTVKYKYQDKWYTDDGNIFGTLNNPYINNGELLTDEYEISDSDEYYDEVEEEYALVNENVNITNYAEFLDLIASDKTQKLIDEGYENEDTVNVIKYFFINDDTYVIY